MMLWFVLLLLLFRAPGSESRLLPTEQVRATKGLCDEEAASDSSFSTAATLFGLRSLLADSNQFAGELNDVNEQKAKGDRVIPEKELLTKLASIQSPSEENHLVVASDHASLTVGDISNTLATSLENGSNLVLEQHEKTSRIPPAHVSENELVSNLASENTGPSEGDHFTVEKNRALPSFSLEHQISTRLESGPSTGGHLVVAQRNRSPIKPSSFLSESEILSNLGKGTAGPSGPSGPDHLTVEKRHRSPPPPISLTDGEILNNLGKGSPSSGPSGPNHLTVEKRHRSLPPPISLTDGEILNNLGKDSPPSSPSDGGHLVAKKKTSLPSFQLVTQPSGEKQSIVQQGHGSEIHRSLATSTPSCCNHLVAEQSKVNRGPPGVDTEEDSSNQEVRIKLAGTPSSATHHLAAVNQNSTPAASPPRQKPSESEQELAEQTETSLDASLKILAAQRLQRLYRRVQA